MTRNMRIECSLASFGAVPQTFWVVLEFNAERSKGVYVSFDTSTRGEHSMVGLPGREAAKASTGGDWMIRAVLAKRCAAQKNAPSGCDLPEGATCTDRIPIWPARDAVCLRAGCESRARPDSRSGDLRRTQGQRGRWRKVRSKTVPERACTES